MKGREPRAHYESVQNLPAASFTARYFQERYFSAPYHFHPEIELTYIIEGKGKRFVGDRIDEYQAGELVLLGENLPHCWKTEADDLEKINARSFVIHFSRDFLGEHFFNVPEMTNISKLLTISKLGIIYRGTQAKEIGDSIQLLINEQNKVNRLLRFLTILDRLSRTDDYELLEKRNINESINAGEREKINQITAYIIDHYREPISVEHVASLIHMTSFAFCKYFKRMTRKTFMDMVIDYRIDFASQLLVNTDLTVSQIAFESGFADPSNFFKAFKKRKKCSPLAYRKSFLL